MSEQERFWEEVLLPFIEKVEAAFDRQSAALALILEALTPEGCGHENWEEITTSGAPHRTYICAEPGCTERKTEPWE